MALDYSLFANSEYSAMAMKPQDIVVALKLLSEGERERPYAVLATELGMSASEVHGAIGRLREGRLLALEGRRVVRQALRDFLLSGIAHVFPAREGEPARGVPTAWAAPALGGPAATTAAAAGSAPAEANANASAVAEGTVRREGMLSWPKAQAEYLKKF